MKIILLLFFFNYFFNKKSNNFPFLYEEIKFPLKPFIHNVNIETIEMFNYTLFNKSNISFSEFNKKALKTTKNMIVLTRPENIVPTIGVNILSNFVANKNLDFIFSRELLKIQAISLLLLTGSCVLNDCFDVEVDKINKPNKRIIQKDVSLKHGLSLSFILFSIPLFISRNMHPNVQFLTKTNMGLLFLYTPVFKTFFGIKNIICSFIIANTILLSSVPFSTSIIDLHKYSNYYSKWYYIFQTSHHNTQYLFLSLFFTCLKRELNYDIRDIEGDRKMNIFTLPVIIGKEKTHFIAKVCELIGLLFAFLTFFK